MKQGDEVLYGVVEIDEVFIGGRRRSSNRWRDKTPIYGMIQRGGPAKAFVVSNVNKMMSWILLKENVTFGSRLMTDDSSVYQGMHRHYDHNYTVHSKYEFVRGETHTNSIEGFWGQLKRSLHGTHHSVSKKWLQSYVDEFIFKYNNRSDVFGSLIVNIVSHDRHPTDHVGGNHPVK